MILVTPILIDDTTLDSSTIPEPDKVFKVLDKLLAFRPDISASSLIELG